MSVHAENPAWQTEARPMRMINDSYRSITFFVEVNIDRFLVPLTIVGALLLAGWLISL